MKNQMDQSEKLTLIDRLVAGIVHELAVYWNKVLAFSMALLLSKSIGGGCADVIAIGLNENFNANLSKITL